MNEKIKPIFIFITAFTVVFLGLKQCDKKSDVNSEKTQNISTPTPKKAAAPINVSADILTSDYDNNEVAADQKYKNKILIVTGFVSDISKTGDHVLVKLIGSSIIYCHLKKGSENAAANLAKGQEVKISGECYGITLVGGVNLSDCTIL